MTELPENLTYPQIVALASVLPLPPQEDGLAPVIDVARTGITDPCTLAAMEARSRLGVLRYGKPLGIGSVRRPAIIDLLQERVDTLMYHIGMIGDCAQMTVRSDFACALLDAIKAVWPQLSDYDRRLALYCAGLAEEAPTKPKAPGIAPVPVLVAGVDYRVSGG